MLFETIFRKKVYVSCYPVATGVDGVLLIDGQTMSRSFQICFGTSHSRSKRDHLLKSVFSIIFNSLCDSKLFSGILGTETKFPLQETKFHITADRFILPSITT